MVKSIGDMTGARILEFDPTRREAPSFRTIVEIVPAAIYTTDIAGRITFYNEAAADLWGCRPEIGKSEFCGSWKLFRPDGSPLPPDECPMAIALREKRVVRGMDAVAERPDGTRVPFMAYPTPMVDANGEMTGALNMLVDIGDRKRAEEIAQRLAAIVQSSDDAIVSKDLSGTITSWNYAAERLFGYLAEEVVGKHIGILIPPDREDEEPAILERIRQGERIDHYETIRRRKDGGLLDISLTVSPIRDGTGRIVGASKIARDITEKRNAEQNIRMLARELEHRVKNVLATVQSIVRLTEAETPSDFRRILSGRLQALSQVQSLLASSRWNGANLRELAEAELSPFGLEGGQVGLTGGPVTLGPQAAQAIALTVHELTTNAAKYGALSTPGGQLAVAWASTDEGLTLAWRESGGSLATPPRRIGFGSKLIESAIRSLGGDVARRWEVDGLACEIRVPGCGLLS